MKDNEYDLWVEGYAATGDASPAHYCGKVRGRTFRNAISSYVEKLPNTERSLWTYNEGTKVWTYWGCRAFDNERDARRAFG